MFLNWIWDILFYFGFYKRAKLMIVGLDNAGKSTLLSLLKHGRLVQHSPTARPGMYIFRGDDTWGITFTAYDLGGHEMARRLWNDYMPAMNAIVFIVDASDKIRISEAKVQIKGILESELPIEVPVVILGNKTDKPGCYGRVELLETLEIQEDVQKYGENNQEARQCQLFMTSMLYRQGYGDAVRWLAAQL